MSQKHKKIHLFSLVIFVYISHTPSVYSYLGIMTALQPVVEKVNFPRVSWKEWFTSESACLEVLKWQTTTTTKGSREKLYSLYSHENSQQSWYLTTLNFTIGSFSSGELFLFIGCIICDLFSLHTKDTCLERSNFCVIRKGVNGAISKEKFGGMERQKGEEKGIWSEPWRGRGERDGKAGLRGQREGDEGGWCKPKWGLETAVHFNTWTPNPVPRERGDERRGEVWNQCKWLWLMWDLTCSLFKYKQIYTLNAES